MQSLSIFRWAIIYGSCYCRRLTASLPARSSRPNPTRSVAGRRLGQPYFKTWTLLWLVPALLIAGVGVGRAASDYSAPYVMTEFVGASHIGSADGRGSAARFYQFGSMTTDAAGNLYLTDMYNHTVRKVTPAGDVTTLAGKAGLNDYADGTGSAARFNNPQGIVVDHSGNLFVADWGNSAIRKITPAGLVSTVLKDNGLDNPSSLAIDADDNVYFTNNGAGTVNRISPLGVVTLVAGSPGQPGDVDGSNADARFAHPQGLARAADGSLYVIDLVDAGATALRKIFPDGHVVTVSFTPYLADGFWRNVIVDGSGNLIFPAVNDCTIVKVSPAGIATVIAGASRQIGYADGAAAAARFEYPQAVALDAQGNLWIGDGNNALRRLSPSGQVTTVAGLARQAATGSSDGLGTAARFSDTCAVAVAPNGDLVVADGGNSIIRRVTAAGLVSTLAGLAGTQGDQDGVGAAARFHTPQEIATDKLGNIFVLDAVPNGKISVRKITPAGEVTTLVASVDMFSSGLAVDAAGNLFFTRRDSVARLGTDGKITTFAGLYSDSYNLNTSGYADGVGANARFNFPCGLGFDGGGNLYVADGLNYAIRKITPDGTVSTLAGRTIGTADGTGMDAHFNAPRGLGVDAQGNIYVMDLYTNSIRKVTPAGKVTTLAGTAFAVGNSPGIGADARFFWSTQIAVKPDGTVFVPSSSLIFQGVPAGAPVITAQPLGVSASSGTEAQFSVTADGQPLPAYQWYFNGSALSGATDRTLKLANLRSADAGDYTVVIANSLGSVTSTKATLTVTSGTPMTPPGGPSQPATGGGGGGAFSDWFLAALLALTLLRRLRSRALAAP